MIDLMNAIITSSVEVETSISAALIFVTYRARLAGGKLHARAADRMELLRSKICLIPSKTAA